MHPNKHIQIKKQEKIKSARQMQYLQLSEGVLDL